MGTLRDRAHMHTLPVVFILMQTAPLTPLQPWHLDPHLEQEREEENQKEEEEQQEGKQKDEADSLLLLSHLVVAHMLTNPPEPYTQDHTERVPQSFR